MKTAALICILPCISFAQVRTADPHELARRVTDNELRMENEDHSHWIFRLQTHKPGTATEVDDVVETENGDLKRPILINGRQIGAAEANKRMRQLAHNRDKLRKSLHDKSEDATRSQRLLKIFSDAFTFELGRQEGELLELNFSPNPRFKPPSHEAQVFHAMKGSLWIDTKQSRLEEIDGRLMHEVKFGGGLLGHLDPGGTFDVKQAEVAPGYWELTLLNVHMMGRALFFKTIAVQQNYQRSNFKPVPDNLTLVQGAEMLQKQSKTERAIQK
jgi:hypothetical protein